MTQISVPLLLSSPTHPVSVETFTFRRWFSRRYQRFDVLWRVRDCLGCSFFFLFYLICYLDMRIICLFSSQLNLVPCYCVAIFKHRLMSAFCCLLNRRTWHNIKDITQEKCNWASRGIMCLLKAGLFNVIQMRGHCPIDWNNILDGLQHTVLQLIFKILNVPKIPYYKYR